MKVDVLFLVLSRQAAMRVREAAKPHELTHRQLRDEVVLLPQAHEEGLPPLHAYPRVV